MVAVDIESENGWRPADLRPNDPRLKWFTVPGTTVTLQLYDGPAAKIMLAVAAAFNQFIEPLRDPDSAAYTDGNSVYTSNHKNATAMDLNWNGHQFKQRGTFAPSQQATIAELLVFCEDTIFWSGNWDDPVDEMHWQMDYDTWDHQDRLLDFINRKIDADGFLTFRRDPTPTTPQQPEIPQPSINEAAAVLYDAVPVIDEDRAKQLVGRIIEGLALAQCNTPQRIAMWLAQVGHESDGFRATEEYASGDETTDRWKYKGRTWIQITWQTNYDGFSKWAWGLGMVTNPSYFVDNPRDLADDKWAAIGPAWYWTVARPTINSLCDQGDIVGVTQIINGGQNGISDRRARYNQALALGDRLMALVKTDAPTPPDTEGALMALTNDEQQELLTKTREIWDQLRGPDGKGWPQLGGLTPVDALAQLINAQAQTSTAATRRAPAKKTPADAAPATNTTATAVAATKAPARKAPAKKAPAKRAPAKKAT